MIHNHNNQANPANKSIPYEMFLYIDRKEFIGKRIKQVLKKIHNKKSRQWFRKYIEQEICDVR